MEFWGNFAFLLLILLGPALVWVLVPVWEGIKGVIKR